MGVLLHILGFCCLFGGDRVETAFLYACLADLELMMSTLLAVNLQRYFYLSFFSEAMGLQAHTTVLATFDC